MPKTRDSGRASRPARPSAPRAPRCRRRRRTRRPRPPSRGSRPRGRWSPRCRRTRRCGGSSSSAPIDARAWLGPGSPGAVARSGSAAPGSSRRAPRPALVGLGRQLVDQAAAARRPRPWHASRRPARARSGPACRKPPAPARRRARRSPVAAGGASRRLSSAPAGAASRGAGRNPAPGSAGPSRGPGDAGTRGGSWSRSLPADLRPNDCPGGWGNRLKRMWDRRVRNART